MREERIVVGRHELMVARPADPESLIDESRFEEDEFLPYWADLWPSGVALARYVAGLDLVGTRVLELGCGLALPSFAAALAGADVVATDWAPEALTLVEANGAANGLPVETAIVDWRAPFPPELGRFDAVLAADVLYEARNAVPILALLEATVSPEGMVLVADPGRRHAPAFFEQAAAAGWSIEHVPAPELRSGSIASLRRATSPAGDETLC
jgi:predicted nicotinamide N-methyase